MTPEIQAGYIAKVASRSSGLEALCQESGLAQLRGSERAWGVWVTGGAGCIGSNLVHCWIDTTEIDTAEDVAMSVDALTCAGNQPHLAATIGNLRHIFVRADIRGAKTASQILARHRPAVISRSAESHADLPMRAPWSALAVGRDARAGSARGYHSGGWRRNAALSGHLGRVDAAAAAFLSKTTEDHLPEHTWNERSIGIDWPVEGELVLSAKDRAAVAQGGGVRVRAGRVAAGPVGGRLIGM